MSKRYRDYVWINGIPFGIEEKNSEGVSYKIVSDPYRKRISLERYHDDDFIKIIYDSALLDFRHLNPMEQMAWEKKQIGDRSFIRNQDDRLLYIEEYAFENDKCRECTVMSPHGVLLARNRMYYEELGDGFNGVVLFDSSDYPVLKKTYKMDENNGEFGELIEEEKDMRKTSFNSTSLN